jgi:hypothetical protein
VVISDNKIESARCILPISKSSDLSANTGLRHKAAVGVTEQSDAIAIVVSEQTGKISYAFEGKLVRNVQPAVLQAFLEEKMLPSPMEKPATDTSSSPPTDSSSPPTGGSSE